MKTQIIPLIGDPTQSLYQLGLKERESFLRIEKRVSRLLSANSLLSHGNDILNRARTLMKKKDETLFDRCLKSYADGLGVELVRYQSFLALFEVAAHYGQVYPELKGLLPGCTSVFLKSPEGITHSRLLDFPLLGIFEEHPRLYYWQIEGRPTLLTYSCEGLAPLFFQGVHGSGMSFALHHKPGHAYHKEGQSIFKIGFETLLESKGHQEFKKEVRKCVTMTKWSFLTLDQSGIVHVMDIDGPSQNVETYNVNEAGPLIFTNIPLQLDATGFESYLKFSESRQAWLKEKLQESSKAHVLDRLTNVEDSKTKKWLHPAATLSTVGAYHINLTKGTLDLKEGQGALVASDEILQVSLGEHQKISTIKKATSTSSFEKAWKEASMAQAFFDEGEYDLAYHKLQMAQALMPHPTWKDIFSFFLYVWDFKFISNSKELALIYKDVKKLKLPDAMKDQWLFLLMRMEKKLDLVPTITFDEVSAYQRELFKQERLASKPVFATWMKLLYPRLELLDIFSPHHR